MKTFTITFFIALFYFSDCRGGGGNVPAILREWAAYAGNSDSTFKTPVISDGSYTFVAAVINDSGSGADIKVFKYTLAGDPVWSLVWNGAGNGRDQAADIAISSDSSIYVCGMTYTSAGNNFDFVLLKISRTGSLQWSRTFNGTASSYDIATSIAINDSEIFVTGVANNNTTLLDYHTIKYDDSGNILWQQDFDYTNLLDIPFDLSWNPEDTSLVVTGGSQSTTADWDYQTVIYANDGILINANRASGSAAGFDRAMAVVTDDSGYVYITGATLASNFDIKTVKLSSTGSYVWGSHYDSGGQDIANDLILAEGKIYQCGSSSGDGMDYFIQCINVGNGSNIWNTHINGSDSYDDTARAMCFDSYGNIVVTGQAFNPQAGNYDFLTICFNRDGDELWRDFFDGPAHGDDNATNISADDNGNIYVSGQAYTEEGMQTVTIKYRTDYFTQPPSTDTPSVANYFYQNYGQLVDENDSDITDSVHFYTIHHSPQLYFGYGVMNMVFSKIDNDTATTDTLQRVDVTFLNSSNPTEALPADEDTTSYVNYYLAQCPNGITNVNGNGSLVFTDVYSNIDAIYSSNNAGLKLTFVCSPGSNPNEIGLSFDGQTSLSVINNWYLKVHTLIGDYEFEKPRVYQIDTSGNRIPVSWTLGWDVSGSDAGFTGWDSYDMALPLIVDISKSFSVSNFLLQNLEWSTYIGGSIADEITAIKKSFINLFATGRTSSSDFPVTPLAFQPSNEGNEDVIVMMFGSSDNKIWATYLGGDNDDASNSIDVDNNNNIFITGGTVSDNFPSKTAYDSSYNGDNDVFVSKLDVAGHLVWSTFFGSGNDEIGWKVKVDPTFTNLYVTGEGSSCQTPIKTFGSYNDTTGGGFISKYDLNGNLIWSTQFGGGCESIIKAIQFNNAGDYFIIGGSTNDSGLDTMNVKINGTYSGGTLDCFISKFKTSNNSLVWSEYYGGTDSELLQSCIIDSHDNIYFAGQTKSDSSSFPLKDYSNSSDYFDNTLELDDAFVLETDSSGSMLWSTYVGGNNGEVIFDLAVDSHDDLICSGITYSNQDLLDTNHANGFFNDNSLDGFSDAFLFAFNKNKVSLWSTYFGGFGGLSEVFNDMDVSFNRLYIAGASSSNSNFPIVASLGAFVDSFPSPNLGKGIFTKFNITNLFVIGNDEIDKNSIQPLVYPIPTHNFIRIPIDKIKSNNITLGLYDILGHEKVNKSILSTETIVTLSLNEFDAGLYFLYIAFDDNKYVYKIIKE